MSQNQRAKFAIVDEWPLKLLPFECDAVDGKRGEIVEPVVDENGVPVFDAPLETVRRLIVAQPARFKLYRSAPIVCSVHNAEFGIEYKTMNPWYYERFTRVVNDEVKWVTEWHEQTTPPWDKAPVMLPRAVEPPPVKVTTVLATPAASEQVTFEEPLTETVAAAPVVAPVVQEEEAPPPRKTTTMDVRRKAIEDATERTGDKERVHEAIADFVSKTGKKSIALLSNKEHFAFLDMMKALE